MANVAKIFVIIVTYKGHQWYERCFTSLRNSEYPVQTIVIDNASNDGTVEYIRDHFPEIHLIESKENLGFGRANNIGMRYALDHGGEYVFLLNQDAWVEPNTIGGLVHIHQEYPSYGLLSPIHLTKEQDHLNMLLDDGKCNHEFLSDLYCGLLKDVYTISYANAAAWLLPRKTLEMIGGFCPMFYHYGEDDDYMNRLKYHRIPMGIVPSVKIVHDTQNRIDGSQQLSERAKREGLFEFLDINIKTHPLSLLIYHIRKWILSFLKFNKHLQKYHSDRIKSLTSNYFEITKVRSLHKTKYPHWL